ncbi:MAG: hypothetical protein JRC86_08990 [Deltaproteobacteria bacterium]|nr:hypothetical protein [Deltaproteobacteria bacterium]
MSLVFPRCYTTGNIVGIPYACAPGRGLTYAKLSWSEPRQPIVDWSGNMPVTTGAWSDDKTVYTFNEGTITATPPSQPSLLDRAAAGINRVLDSGDKATGAATVGGYAVIALIGAGLLFWYVPRKKR